MLKQSLFCVFWVRFGPVYVIYRNSKLPFTAAHKIEKTGETMVAAKRCTNSTNRSRVSDWCNLSPQNEQMVQSSWRWPPTTVRGQRFESDRTSDRKWEEFLNTLAKVVGFLRVLRFPPTGKVDGVG